IAPVTRKDHAMDEQLRIVMNEVPTEYHDRLTKNTNLTDVFCDNHHNTEYKSYCRAMAATLCQDGSPALKGKVDGWAAGIVYALGGVNFLHDPSQTPHMKLTDISKDFDISTSTMQAKATTIRKAL